MKYEMLFFGIMHFTLLVRKLKQILYLSIYNQSTVEKMSEDKTMYPVKDFPVYSGHF